jgi:O-acetyl-ADP-ribose deacetylase (regulator of RNase III)
VKQRLFIGSSREAIGVSRAVQAELSDEFAVTVWDQDVFKLSYSALDSLLDQLDSSDAGIFVLSADDLTTSREVSVPSVRDNVTFELGMFLGRLGRDHTFMLTPSTEAPTQPSDLFGITTAIYDADRLRPGELRAAVAPACTEIRDHLASLQRRVSPEPISRARLDQAMTRMSRDLEWVLGVTAAGADADDEQPLDVSARINRAKVQIVTGLIQDYPVDDSVVALPANEYFDDECVNDTNSSLGAYVQHHFKDSLEQFLAAIEVELTDLPSERVPRGERRIDDSYGIGRALYLKSLASAHRIILTSATTERAAIGLRAEPHFLYAAMQGTIETMNANRLYSLVMPVFGSGHGGMPPIVALLFNLLAIRSCLTGEAGLRLDQLRIVVFDGATERVTQPAVEDVLSRVLGAR